MPVTSSQGEDERKVRTAMKNNSLKRHVPFLRGMQETREEMDRVWKDFFEKNPDEKEEVIRQWFEERFHQGQKRIEEDFEERT